MCSELSVSIGPSSDLDSCAGFGGIVAPILGYKTHYIDH